MDKNIIGTALLVPVLLFSGTGAGGGSKCNFTKPALVFERACLDASCLAKVKQYLPQCERSLRSDLTKAIRYKGGVETAPHLSLAVMGKLTDCISKADFGRLDRASIDLSAFKDVPHDVRAEKLEKLSGGCAGTNCAQVYVRPGVGTTTFLYGPA